MARSISNTSFSPRQFFLPVLSGLLLTLSFPKIGAAALAWIALIPFLIAIDGGSPRRAFLSGLIFGLVHYSGLLYWVAGVMYNYGNLPVTVSVAILLLLVIYLSLYTAAFACLIAVTKKAGLGIIFTAPVLWVSLEYLRAKLLTGFPWENISYTQYTNLHVIQICDILGNYGLSFYIVLVNAVLASLIYSRQAGQNRARAFKLYIPVLLAVSLVYWGYGFYRLQDIEEKIKTAPRIRAAVVQGSIKQDLKWSPLWQRETINIYDGLSREAARGFDTDILIWPETAAPFYFQDGGPLSDTILRLTGDLKTNLLFGAPAYAKAEDGKPLYLNSAYLLSANEGAIHRYDKVRLVPFGEYVPARPLLPFIGKLVASVGDFTPGRSLKPLAAARMRIGILICFESIFPELARQQVRNGANLLVNITNDAWFGRSSAPYQHMSMAVFRAVENRISLARAANTGISLFVRPTGEITQTTSLFTPAFLREEIVLVSEKTVYNQWGEFFPVICFIFGIMVIFYTGWRFNHVNGT
ncbi:MAG: apolipoprotein N-acyltransferase [Desulfovibrionales bacterium]|nr:apolipoprotein N-acyltransferase [Desulfovibrionales bacterium]